MISVGTIHSGISSRVSREDDWGKAQQRLILYLQSLKIPPFEVLELALEALKIAHEKWEGGDEHPVTASMRALRHILFRRAPKGELRPEIKQMMLDLPFLEQSDRSHWIRSMPPLNRGIMVPEKARQRLSSHPSPQPGPS